MLWLEVTGHFNWRLCVLCQYGIESIKLSPLIRDINSSQSILVRQVYVRWDALSAENISMQPLDLPLIKLCSFLELQISKIFTPIKIKNSNSLPPFRVILLLVFFLTQLIKIDIYTLVPSWLLKVNWNCKFENWIRSSLKLFPGALSRLTLLKYVFIGPFHLSNIVQSVRLSSYRHF
jgi:hypothetical protein